MNVPLSVVHVFLSTRMHTLVPVWGFVMRHAPIDAPAVAASFAWLSTAPSHCFSVIDSVGAVDARFFAGFLAFFPAFFFVAIDDFSCQTHLKRLGRLRRERQADRQVEIVLPEFVWRV